MPGLSGLDALPAIRALAPDTKVVMVDLVHLGRTLETIRTMTAHRL